MDQYFALSEVKNGIIIIHEVNIYPGPFLRDDAVLFRIHEGVKLEIIQKQTNSNDELSEKDKVNIYDMI